MVEINEISKDDLQKLTDDELISLSLLIEEECTDRRL